MHTTSLNLDNFGNFLNFRFKFLLFSKIQVACQPRPRFLILHSTTVRLNGTFAVADPENFGGGDCKHKTAKIRMSSPKLRVIFWPKSEIQTFFSPKIRCSPTKKKKKVFTKIESDFSAEIGNSNDFFAQNQMFSKKK